MRLKCLSECMSLDEFLDKYMYLTNRDRGKFTTMTKLRIAYFNKLTVKIIKRFDPILYQQMKSNKEIYE